MGDKSYGVDFVCPDNKHAANLHTFLLLPHIGLTAVAQTAITLQQFSFFASAAVLQSPQPRS
jgi:hypothetical protein